MYLYFLKSGCDVAVISLQSTLEYLFTVGRKVASINLMNLSAKYTTEATLDYFTLPAGDKVSTMSFVQQLSVYGTQTCSCGPAAFLNSVADTAMLAGQGLVGAMREGKNNQCLGEARLNVNTAPNPQQEVSCVPAVTPVY